MPSVDQAVSDFRYFTEEGGKKERFYMGIGVARGVTGWTYTPREEKKCWPNSVGQFVSALYGQSMHPVDRARVHLLGNWGDMYGGSG